MLTPVDENLDLGMLPVTNQFPFTPAADTVPARWLIESLYEWPKEDFLVSNIIPPAFDAYARIYHPAWLTGDEAERVRWANVAAMNNCTAHPNMRWSHITGGSSDKRIQPPCEGTLPAVIARPIWQMLADCTTTPECCWFAVWEGWGGLSSEAQAGSKFGIWSPYLLTDIDVPQRRYHLHQGAIENAEKSFDPRFSQSANIWWPDDHAWCVHTEIDARVTYIGGSQEAIQALVEHPDLEACAVQPTDRFYPEDTINPPHR